MADALGAVAISALAAGFAFQLLARCASDIRMAREHMAATRIAERVYEEARLEDAASLVSPAEGQAGALSWRRTGQLTREATPGVTGEAVPVRLVIAVADRRRPVFDLEAIVLPAPAGVTGPEGSPSPKS